MDLFPELSAEEIEESVSIMWALSGRLPMPRFKRKCPICRGLRMQARLWRFFPRKAKERGRMSHRCDVGVKCTWCGLVLTFGVALTEDQYWRFIRGVPGRDSGGRVTIHWRQALRLIEQDE